MKKLLMMLLVSCLMTVCSVCLAADDYKDLQKQQQTVERMMDVFNGDSVPAYAQVSAGFSENMKKSITKEKYVELQKQVRVKFGALKEAKFYSYQRFDQIDRVTYVASFSKEKMVSMVFAFDKQNKLLDFAFAPIQQPDNRK